MSRLEALLVLLGPLSDAVRQCWHFLMPCLIRHVSRGTVVAGTGCHGDDCEESLQLCAPQRVACTTDGSVLIADWGNGRLCQWRAGSGMVFAKGDMRFTYAVCCDSSGFVYATTENGVACLSPGGQELDTSSLSQVSASAGLWDHCGLCPDGHGGVYVADHLNDRVVRIQPAGMVEMLGPFFSDGCSTSRLSCPADVELSSAGHLYIADREGGRVLQYQGKGAASILISDLEQPYALSSNGDLLYVAEFGRNRVLCIHCPCGTISQILYVETPTGLCFGRALELYVTERNANRVLCFEPVIG